MDENSVISHREPPTLLSLPPELLDIIFGCLGFPVDGLPEMAALERVSKLAQRITEPYLYHRVCTNIKDEKISMDTKGMVALFARRPHLAEMVYGLVVDEFDAASFWNLLKIDFPNMRHLLMQHKGPLRHPSHSYQDLCNISEHWRPQPNLTNLVMYFDIQYKRESDSPEVRFNYRMIHHPSLKRIRLVLMDLIRLGHVQDGYYKHTHLDELILELCPFLPSSLEKLIAPSRCLRTLVLHEIRSSPFLTTRDNMILLMRVLSLVAETLVTFKMSWQTVAPPDTEWEGFDFSSFGALRHLHVPPIFLFTLNRFPSPDEASCAKTLQDILPPRLKILSLEDLIPLNPDPPPPQGMGIEISMRNEYLLSTLLRHKDELAPYLTRIYGYYNKHLTEGVRRLADLAYDCGIFLVFQEEKDDCKFDMGWLCADGNDPFTVSHN